MIWFQKFRLTTASLSISLFLLTFGIYCAFWRWLRLIILWFPITMIAPLIVRLFQIGSSWVYLYCARTISIDKFAGNIDWTISIDRFAELSQTIYIDQLTGLAQTISICKYFWFLTSGAFFWTILRVKITLPLSISYTFYQYLSLQLGSIVVFFS